MSRKRHSCKKPTYIFTMLLLSCTQHVPKAHIDGPVPSEGIKKRVTASEKKGGKSAPRGIHEKWLVTCRDQLHYLKHSHDPAPKIDWTKAKKEALIKLAVKDIYEQVPEWSQPEREHTDSGTHPVNIAVNSNTAQVNTVLNKGYLMVDGEIETEVEWEKDGVKKTTPIRSWTGREDGIKNKPQDKESAVCLTAFDLKSWGMVERRDVVVLLEKTYEGEGCLQYYEDKKEWLFDGGWSSLSRSPCYTMIMWEENGEWKSTMRSKNIHPLKEEEICQVLGEQWGIIPRKGPPPPLLKFGDD